MHHYGAKSCLDKLGSKYPNAKSDRLLAVISYKYSDFGQLDQALRIARHIEESSPKAKSLANVAANYANAGQKEDSASLLAQAFDIIGALDRGFDSAVVMTEIAARYAKAGRNEEAMKILVQALEETRTISDDSSMAYVLPGIVIVSSDIGDNKTADKLFSEALGAVKKVEKGEISQNYQDYLLAEMAGKFIEADQVDKALTIARQIRGAYKIRVLAEIADTYTKKDQHPEAVSLLDDARELLKEVGDEEEGKSVAMATLAYKYAAAGQIDQALKVNDMIPDEQFNAWAMGDILAEFSFNGGNAGTQGVAYLCGTLPSDNPMNTKRGY